MSTDQTRSPIAKRRRLSRRAQRHLKLAQRFLLIAFDPPAGSFACPQGKR